MRGLTDLAKVLMLILVAACSSTAGTDARAVEGAAVNEESLAALVQAAEKDGSAPVIVRLTDEDGTAFRRKLRERRITAKQLGERRAAVARAQDGVAAALGGESGPLHRFKYQSYLALRADAATLRRLRDLPGIDAIYPDRAHPPALLNSVPLIGADLAWAAGYDGTGQAVAVLDTGVQSNHEMFPAGKVVNEACFSGTNSGAVAPSAITSLCNASIGQCPGFTSNTACGDGAAAPCTVSGPCWHGTHVAGVAVGDGPLRHGVAPGASLVPIQVFVYNSSGGLLAYDSDLIAAMEHVLDLSQTGGIDVAAVNMSLGGDRFSSTAACDAASAPFKEAVDNLRAAGIATVVAAGNDGRTTEISFPGCISSAVSVGATNNSDAIASFSNRSNALSVFAPGYVTSAVTGDGNDYGYAYGTSMAAPHVAGGMAVLAQKSRQDGSGATVDNLVSALRESGVPISLSSTVEVPRIQVDGAVSLLDGPAPLDLVLDANIALRDGIHDCDETSHEEAPVCIAQGEFEALSTRADYGCGSEDDIELGCPDLTGSYAGDAMTGVAPSENAIQFRPGLPPGYYNILSWRKSYPSNTIDAYFMVDHGGDSDDLLARNQTGGAAEWEYLGFYFLDGGSLVEVSDGGQPGLIADALRFQFVEAGPTPLLVESRLLPGAKVSDAYYAQLLARGGYPPYRWSVTSGALPSGVVLASNGALTGTPEESGTFDFAVWVTDSNNDRSPPQPLQLQSAADLADIYSDAFDDGNFAGWTVVNKGTNGAASAWSVSEGEVLQDGNICTPDALGREGTYLIYDGGSSWADYGFAVRVRSGDDDHIGVMFRIVDDSNYYRFSWSRQESLRRLMKKEGGVFSVLAQDTAVYQSGRTYQLEVLSQGDLLEVRIDGVPLFSVEDGAHGSGTIALYSCANEQSYFDNVLVESLSGGVVNQAPVIAQVIAQPATILETATSQITVEASDPDAGPRPLSYSWTVPAGGGNLNDPTSATPTYIPPDVTGTQAYTLTVEVSDGAAVASGEVQVTVTDADASPVLLADDFGDGNFAGWTVVDKGTNGAASAWLVRGGEVLQDGNICTPDVVGREGTYLLYGGGSGWADYRFGVDLRSGDDDHIGVMFRFVDDNNYYRFSWSRQESLRRLMKKEGGVFSVLAQDTAIYQSGRTYRLEVLARGNVLELRIDGVLIFTVEDSAHASGTIALYTCANEQGYFDNALVEAVTGGTGNQAPILIAMTATPAIIPDTATSQIAVVATDADGGPQPLSYQWAVPLAAGSLDDPTSPTPTYIPPNVSGTKAFTLTVEVSDGAAVATGEVQVTVTDASAPLVLLDDDFGDGNFAGWTVVDKGTNGAASAWSVSGGEVLQDGNICTSDPLGREGTYLIYDGGSGWTDYRFVVRVRSGDDDHVGVMFRVEDDNNYYRFSWSRQESLRRLMKKEGDVFSVLAQDTAIYQSGRTYQLEVLGQGNVLEVRIDGVPVFSVEDGAHGNGTIALYTCANQPTYFDGVRVETPQ